VYKRGELFSHIKSGKELTNIAIGINIPARSNQMLSVRGVYERGKIKLKEKVPTTVTTPVIVTFLEDIEKEKEEPRKLNLAEFSFNRSRELLKDYKGSLSDAVIEERRRFV
jgi:hypothetical protein